MIFSIAVSRRRVRAIFALGLTGLRLCFYTKNERRSFTQSGPTADFALDFDPMYSALSECRDIFWINAIKSLMSCDAHNSKRPSAEFMRSLRICTVLRIIVN
jgi:hypothetical protein